MKTSRFGKIELTLFRIVKNSVLAFCITLLLTGLALQIKAQTAVGYVQEVKGNWFLTKNPSQSLRQGQKLPAAGVIRIQSPTRDDRIVIANLRGEIIAGASRNCREQDCSKSFRLPNNSPQPSYWSGIYDSVMALIWGSPSRYSVHRSRGEELQSGVAKLENKTINLAPILKAQGKYYLRWRQISISEKSENLKKTETTETGDWLETIAVEWNGENPTSASIAKLSPGLYEVNLLKERGKNLEATPTFAWILVAASADYEKSAASFREAVEKTKQWDKQVSETAASIFLHAFLDKLARQNLQTVK